MDDIWSNCNVQDAGTIKMQLPLQSLRYLCRRPRSDQQNSVPSLRTNEQPLWRLMAI